MHHLWSTGELSLTVYGRSCLLYPVGQVPNKVEEEIPFRNTDNFVGNLDKEAEAFAGSEVEPLNNVLTEIPCSG